MSPDLEKSGSAVKSSGSQPHPNDGHRSKHPPPDMQPIQEYDEDDIEVNQSLARADVASLKPPSFAQSEFQTIVRRQRHGGDPDGLKVGHRHERHPHLRNDWEFSGWGSMQYLDVPDSELSSAQSRFEAPRHYLNRLLACAVAGNDITGGVFYTFPLVAAAAGVYAPICLVIACLLLFLLRPLLLELASAAHLNGANYIYLLQFSGKTMGVVGATATLLDAICTSTVSAATASSYLSGEFSHLPISPAVITMIMIIGLGVLALAGLRESASVSAAIFAFHLLTMTVLFITSVVHWATTDPHSSVLRSNWAGRPTTAADTAHSIFFGTCIAFLGVTGFECTPSYVEHLRPRTYSRVLRDLIIGGMLVNGLLSFVVYALLPSSTVLEGHNVLSTLAEVAGGGKWLRYWTVVDAVSVLLGGILTGVVTAGTLLDRLAKDRILPQFFLLKLPVTNGAYIATLFALGLALLLYVASALSIETVSDMFSVSFVFELLLYVVSALLLKFNRPHLPVAYRASMPTVLCALVAMLAMWIGNVVANPLSLGLWAASFAVVFTALLLVTAQPSIVRLLLRLHGSSPLATYKWTSGWSERLVRWYRYSRSARVCVWIKDDNIHTMLQALLSVQKNSPDARTVVFVHAYPTIDQIPSELHPNTRLLDEAFPSITIDLSFVQGSFSPTLVEAASSVMNIQPSRMCIIALGHNHPWTLADYGGVRIIM
ncbi:hypothetical protein PENSPDRAFT_656347 [Peniophora sp. CONT]|nr:hypothetical protein PENSPDRAFT_656347 [Peniophora sp. CONT]